MRVSSSSSCCVVLFTPLLQWLLIIVCSSYLVSVTNAQNPCTLIAIVVDESGSMSGEQAFLRDDAMPVVIEQLKLDLQKEVFVCSFGFGTTLNGGGPDSLPHLEGCSEGFDVADYQYVASGGFEDGWRAIEFANEYTANQTEIDGIVLEDACGSVNKFMILVTDEDRDFGGPQTFNSTLELLEDNGWSLHAILDQSLIPSEAIGCADNQNGTWTYFNAITNSAGDADYVELLTAVDPIGVGEGLTSTQYVPLAFQTDGAVWNLNKLRDGGMFAQSFSKAFKEISVTFLARANAICQDVSKAESCEAVVTPAEVSNGSTGELSLTPSGPYADGDVVTLSAALNGETSECQAIIRLLEVCEDDCDAAAECDLFFGLFGRTGTQVHRNIPIVGCVNSCASSGLLALKQLFGWDCGSCEE